MKKIFKEIYHNASKSSNATPLQGNLLKQLQSVLLNALKEIDDVCRLYGRFLSSVRGMGGLFPYS